jgi:hypothetical protein
MQLDEHNRLLRSLDELRTQDEHFLALGADLLDRAHDVACEIVERAEQVLAEEKTEPVLSQDVRVTG